jgi:hypothetical protein
MPLIWGPVRGQIIFDSARHVLREEGVAGFSMMGTRSLLVTDFPAVYVHDTGGFGAPFVASAAPAREPEVTVELVERSTRLVADLKLPEGRRTRLTTGGPLSPEFLAPLVKLGGRLLPDAEGAAFVSPCAISISLVYEDEAPAPAERTAYVLVKGGRLALHSGGRALVDWPVNRVLVTPTGPTSVEVRGGAVLDGRFLSGAVLHLVTPDVLRAFATVMAAARPDPAAVGTSAPVTARGIGGDTDPTPVDCVLGESVIELQALAAPTVLASFDLADPQLRVAGTAERFVVFHPAHGPVSVHSGAEAFGRRLHAHPALRAAAERTLATGPYPAELPDGRPVACAVAPDAVRVKGSGVDLRIPFTELRTVEGDSTPTRASLRLAAAEAEVTLTGQLELIRAVHTDVAAGSNATADPRQVPDLLRAAVGLEEDYFLYTVFGPFYELHAALLGDVEAGGLSAAVPPPESDEERARVAAVLAEGLAELQRHLDQVGYVLPAFVRHRDAELIGAEPAWLKAQEAQLRSALAPVQRAAAETAQLAAQATRLLDLDPTALPPPSYAGAAVSLGAAALLNPVFAVSGLSQAYSQYSQGVKRKEHLTAQTTRGWTLVLERWNTLVTLSVPVLGYVLTENLFALRWEAARHLTEHLRDAPAETRPAALRQVARRLARLDVMRRYPVNAGIRLRRGEIAEHLRAARDAITTPRFADF